MASCIQILTKSHQYVTFLMFAAWLRATRNQGAAMKYRLLVCLFVALGLAACGGGTVVATSSTSPVVTPTATAVSASNVAVGGSLVVTGTNLSRVTAFQIAGVTVSTSAV